MASLTGDYLVHLGLDQAEDSAKIDPIAGRDGCRDLDAPVLRADQLGSGLAARSAGTSGIQG